MTQCFNRPFVYPFLGRLCLLLLIVPPAAEARGLFAPKAQSPQQQAQTVQRIMSKPAQPDSDQGGKRSYKTYEMGHVLANDPKNPDKKKATEAAVKSMVAHDHNPKKGFVVPYMDDKERKAHKAHAGPQGQLTDKKGKPISPKKERELLYVMDGKGKLYVGKESKVRNHSSFMAGEPVAGAGKMTVKDGVVTSVSNDSGHYMPPAKSLDNVQHSLTNRYGQAPVPDSKVHEIVPREDKRFGDQRMVTREARVNKDLEPANGVEGAPIRNNSNNNSNSNSNSNYAGD